MSKTLFICYVDGKGFINVNNEEQKIRCYCDTVMDASEAEPHSWKQLLELHSDEFELIGPRIHFLRVPVLGLSEMLEEPKSLWQPIATAPRDGTRILLIWRGCNLVPTVGRWMVSEGDPFCSAGFRCEGDNCIPINQHDCILWMPIPEAQPVS